MNSSPLGKMLMAPAVLAATLVLFTVPQEKPRKSCGGLHAAIRAELVRRDPPYTQPPFVMLTFVLLNDSEAPINSVEGGWQIVIDGKELKDSDFIFGNGPGPIGGYGILNPGESYEFGKGLELSRYFPEEREYKVSWKGKWFQSSTITVKVTPRRGLQAQYPLVDKGLPVCVLIKSQRFFPKDTRHKGSVRTQHLSAKLQTRNKTGL